RQSRSVFCADRKDLTSFASEPKAPRHSEEMKCRQDFRSSARLSRRAPRRIPSQRSSGTGLESAVSKSMGNLRQCDRSHVLGMGDVCNETLDIREITNILGVVLEDNWNLRQHRFCGLH